MMSSENNLEIDYAEIGKRLRKVRGARSQTAFGQPLGYKYGYVKDCEHGKKPSLEYLVKVSAYYKVSLDWLIRSIAPIGFIGSGCQITAETGSDPDLNIMIRDLKILMQNGDSDLRGWTKIQFRRTFSPYCETIKNYNTLVWKHVFSNGLLADDSKAKGSVCA